MYKKAISLLLAGNLLVILGLLWAGAASDAKTASRPVSQLSLTFGNAEEEETELALEDLEEKAGQNLAPEELEEKEGQNLAPEDLGEKAEWNLALEDLEEKAGQGLTFEDAGAERWSGLTLEKVEKKARQQETLRAASVQNISMGMGTADVAVSGQRIVDYALVEKTDLLILSEEELETLQRIVEAEAGSEDEDGRLLVANVVLNRVNSESFPGTVTEVVFQREHGVSQFSPVANGRFFTVEISDLTVSAVGRALAGEDISEGALFFASRKHADSDKMRWFDEHLTFLFKHGGHEFFK